MFLSTKSFEDLNDDLLLPWPFRKTPSRFEDLEFRHCTFSRCQLSLSGNPNRRTVVSHVNLLNCRAIGCDLNQAIVEDVLVDGLSTPLLSSWGAVFKHVTLRNRIGSILLNHLVTPSQPDSRTQHMFAVANAAYYTQVDWALDIREAEFEEDVDLRGIPGTLIRRDPTTQVLVTRAKALEGKWRQLPLERTYWPTAIEFFLRDNAWDSTVLVAPKRIRTSPTNPYTYQDLVDGLHLLRDEGVAELD